MINQITTMLYVNDVKEAANFWQQGFNLSTIETIDLPDGFFSFKLSVLDQLSLQLFDKKFIQKYSPEVATNNPSLLFSTNNIEELHHSLLKVSPFVSEISGEIGFRQFNFSDNENNYFAVTD